jgi:hypothetical protein
MSDSPKPLLHASMGRGAIIEVKITLAVLKNKAFLETETREGSLVSEPFPAGEAYERFDAVVRQRQAEGYRVMTRFHSSL